MSRKTTELSAKATYSQKVSTATRVEGDIPVLRAVVAAEHPGDHRGDDAREVEALGQGEGPVGGDGGEGDLDHRVVDALDGLGRGEAHEGADERAARHHAGEVERRRRGGESAPSAT
jgi:hypothetical protein